VGENINKPGYICARCGAVTDYPKAFCRKCLARQICFVVFWVFGVFATLMFRTFVIHEGNPGPAAIISTLVTGFIAVIVGLAISPLGPITYLRNKFRKSSRSVSPSAADDSEKSEPEPESGIDPWADDEPSISPDSDKLAKKKRELHDLEVDIVRLRNAEARRATLATEIKKLDRAIRIKNYPRLSIILGSVAVLVLFVSVGLGICLSQAQQEKSQLQQKIVEVQESLAVKSLQLDNVSKANEDKSVALANLRLDYNKKNRRSIFVEQYIGIIVEGSNYYHVFDCEDLRETGFGDLPYLGSDFKSFFAHNVEYCEYLGYIKCPKCH
jgi:hypothetical protein